jgi:glutamate decarboxylase
MKLRWQRKREMQRRPRGRPNLICGPVHVCWQKFAKFFGVELRQVPCEGNRLLMSAEEVLKRCDENTIGVVPTLGLTYTLKYEPVEAIATALDDLEEQQGLNIPLHIDAASGGFVAPFIHPDLRWDFRIPRVKSINTSGHKFGLSPLGCGWIIWREPHDLPEEVVFRVKYLGGNMPTIALNFSRPGGQVVSQYYNFVRLGKDGYTKITEGCAEVWPLVRRTSSPNGPVRFGLRRPWRFARLLLDAHSRCVCAIFFIRCRGSFARTRVASPAYPMPANRKDLIIQRVLARFGLSRDLAGLLAEDLQRAVTHVKKHSSGRPITGQEASGYHHG